MKAIIYAATDVFYYSFYIKGVYDFLGKRNVTFSCSDFPNFPERTFALIFEEENYKRKIIIDAFDSSDINVKAAEWSDIYGKVNYDSNNVPSEFLSKIKVIGPSFAIRVWSFPGLVYHLCYNYIKARKRIHLFDNFIKNYWRQYKRLRIEEYTKNIRTSENYIYSMNSLWEKESRVNQIRACFFKACKNLESVIFEGGFAPRSDNKTLGYDDFLCQRDKFPDYLNKTKKSFVVFNTPAVQKCHGWKLAEYLALGKAIISTDIFNELPKPLRHEKEIHYLSENDPIEEVILRIKNDDFYRVSLEKSARKYFEDVLKPEIVIKKLSY